MNRLNEVRQFKKIAGLIKESHPANDKWYQDFEDGLRNLVRNKYISKDEYKYYMDALDHVDPMDDYGHMASAHDAAKEFVDDLRSKGSVKESDKVEEDFRGFNHRAIEAAADDKISHTEEDDNGDPIYWSTKNPYVNYYIGSNDQIIKYNGKTGERYPIGDLGDYDQNKPDEFPFDYDDFPSKDDTDADYEEPRDDFDMAEVKKFKKIAGIKEDDYSEDPSSDLDDESESGDTATMGNINEWNPDKEWDEEDDEEESGEDYPSDEDLFGMSENDMAEDEITAHVTQEVQKLADELMAKGRIGPKQAKKVMDYVAKHAKRLYRDLELPQQWFNAAASTTWKSKGHRRGTKVSEDDMDARANQDSKTQYGQGGVLNV